MTGLEQAQITLRGLDTQCMQHAQTTHAQRLATKNSLCLLEFAVGTVAWESAALRWLQGNQRLCVQCTPMSPGPVMEHVSEFVFCL
eukprot:CAMPEP_0174379278 /NCGR_PEP_ID=MMETSP0811_2-20130205/122601_1 /TAXON_ID=73025 ORGANISM="Eutreptiella gymnastica-like, Strain CCMP1594" /NCGR_SAMPLE_ID=MMETSP0811_2 /ASSEMBLY_ACC=CAM_ASM_000667 /LENGTH=85 /DNA_ID=CAMNT_0015531759 /DNA_START=1287 /DNA_END=1544 /DNA_ORIENTATION=+